MNTIFLICIIGGIMFGFDDAIAGGINLAGNVVNNMMQQSNVQQQEKFQASQVANAQQYNTQMADTQYQRGVADMKAAGLNPILAAGGGGNAAPTSPVASGAVAQSTNLAEGVTNSALQSKSLNLQSRQQDNNDDTTEANVNLMKAQAVSALANSAKNQALKPLYDIGGQASNFIKQSVPNFFQGISDWFANSAKDQANKYIGNAKAVPSNRPDSSYSSTTGTSGF